MIFYHLIADNTHYPVFADDKYLILLFLIDAIKPITTNVSVLYSCVYVLTLILFNNTVCILVCNIK